MYLEEKNYREVVQERGLPSHIIAYHRIKQSCRPPFAFFSFLFILQGGLRRKESKEHGECVGEIPLQWGGAFLHSQLQFRS
jgi:hypothetical protein